MTTTPTNLRAFAGLAPAEVLPDNTLQMYIDQAVLIRNEDFDDSGLSEDRLDKIELNLSAHFAIVAQERGGLTQQVVGQSEERYAGAKVALAGLGATLFGQQALALDTSGILSKYATSPVKALFQVI